MICHAIFLDNVDFIVFEKSLKLLAIYIVSISIIYLRITVIN